MKSRNFKVPLVLICVGSNSPYIQHLCMSLEDNGTIPTLVSKVENAYIQSSNVDRRVLTGRWQNPGDCTPYGRLQTDGVVAVTRPTSRFIQDYNVLTFNSLTVGYDFNAEWLKKARIGLLRVELSGNDLFRVSTVRAERGLDYPYSRSFAASVKMSF